MRTHNSILASSGDASLAEQRSKAKPVAKTKNSGFPKTKLSQTGGLCHIPAAAPRLIWKVKQLSPGISFGKRDGDSCGLFSLPRHSRSSAATVQNSVGAQGLVTT